MSVNHVVEGLLRRDRAVVLAGLAGITVLAWLYLVLQAAPMPGMMTAPAADSMAGMAMDSSAPEPATGMNMAMPGMDIISAPAVEGVSVGTSGSASTASPSPGWTLSDALLTFLMWAVMMVAMMTPSAAPMILLYARVVRRKGELGLPYAPTAVFFAGYVAIWFAFSAGATGLQWALANSALLSPVLVSMSPLLTAVLLFTAGLYQFAPAKQACLRQCRSPVEWLSRHWHPGIGGAFQMGLAHGRICLGCCWVLMLLLFVGGVMNLVWVAVIAALVLAEKVAPKGRRIGRVGGVALLAAGLLFLVMG